jgi:transposase
MSVTENIGPGRPTGRPTAGVDWASEEHAVSVVGPHGVELERFTVEHTAAGIARLLSRLRRAGVVEVGIERPDGPVVDALLGAALVVLVISPNQIRGLRSRYGQAGNKDDSFDAFVLADTVRTDRARLRPLSVDSAATVTLRMTVRARKDLIAARIAMANQLRAHLNTVLPGAVGLFRDLDSPISLRFLARFCSQDKVDWLSVARLRTWLSAAGYNNPARAGVLHAHLAAAARGTTGTDATARTPVTLALVAGLSALREQIRALDDAIAVQLEQHPDAKIFTSLPRSGTVRAARLLAEIGDARGRFPTPQALTCLAGAAPSTRQSGKHKIVAFRWAVDKQLRGAVIDFAGDSHHANPWAADLYQRARDRGHDHPHAVRILARAWLHIIWRCRQDRVPYDPTKHRALQTVLNQAA